MFSTHKTVLVLSDDAVAIYSPVRGRFSFLGEVRWQDPEFLSTLGDYLSLKGHSRPILILYDMVEQYYRREVVPKVAFLDQPRVLARRIAAAFPNYPLRSSLPLQFDKKNKSKAAPNSERGEKSKALEGKPYLFVALPESDHMGRITEAVRQSMTVARSLTLLPVESVSMVKQLSNVLNGGAGSPERWTVFISQHRGGGLRQIVVRNGELALTRLTPIVDTDIEPDIWANEVAEEFSATMGYLSRFGYNNNSELEIIVLGNPEAINLLQPQIKATYFHGLSVRDAARALRLNIDAQDDLRYGDVLHVAWLARKMQPVLPFKLSELAFVSRVRMAARAISTLLLMVTVAGIGYAGYQAINLYQTRVAVDQARATLKDLEKEYAAELKRKEEFNIDVKLVQGSIAIFDNLEKNRVDILAFLQSVAKAMTPDISFDRIQMQYNVVQQENPDPTAIQTVQKRIFTSNLEISFPATLKPELGNKVVSDLRERLAKELVDYDVVVSQPVRDMTFRTEFNYQTGQDVENKNATSNERLVAIISLTKRASEK